MRINVQIFFCALICFIVLCSGCIGKNVTCNKPYILVGEGCCLDQNDNKICDSDENNANENANSITTTLPEINQDYSEYLNRFTAYNDGEDIILYFYLIDEQEQEIAVDGTVKLTIVDNDGVILFDKTLEVKSKDYIKSTLGLLSTQEHLLFAATIPIDELKKSRYTRGTASLVFTLPDGRQLNASVDDVDIPQLSEEEVLDLFEQNYLESATEIDMIKKDNDFVVTILRAGYYTHFEYETWGDEITELRVDISVKNTGSEKRNFRAWDALLLYDNRQYEPSYQSTLRSEEIYPGVIVEGYMLFEDVPNLEGNTFNLIAGTSYDYDEYEEVEHKFNNIRF